MARYHHVPKTQRRIHLVRVVMLFLIKLPPRRTTVSQGFQSYHINKDQEDVVGMKWRKNKVRSQEHMAAGPHYCLL